MTKSQQNEHAFSANGELSIYNLSHPGGAPQRLAAPALDSTQGVTLAGASIGEHAAWRPMQAESLPFQSETAQIRVPAASAALVFLT